MPNDVSRLMPAAGKGTTDIDICISELEKALADNEQVSLALKKAEEEVRRAEDIKKRAAHNYSSRSELASKAAKLIQEKQSMLGKLINSPDALFKYHAYTKDRMQYKEMYKALRGAYDMLKDCFAPGQWFVLEDNNVEIKTVKFAGKEDAHQFPFSILAIGVLNDNPVKPAAVTHSNSSSPELEVRVYFQPEGYILSRPKDGQPRNIVEFIKEPTRNEFGIDKDGKPYWRVPPQLLLKLESDFGVIRYKNTLDDPRILNIYVGDEKVSKLGLDPEPRSAKRAFDRKYKHSTRMHKAR